MRAGLQRWAVEHVLHGARAVLVRARTPQRVRDLAARAAPFVARKEVYETSAPLDMGGSSGRWITPAGSPQGGIILYFHGGGFIAECGSIHDALLAAIGRSAGARGLMIDYRLAPQFRYPAAVDDAVRQSREGIMGTLVATGLDAPVKLARVLEAGGHVAMLVDQHYVRGVDVTFFGRTCKANPLLAQLARLVDCPIHGARMVRLPDHNRFRIDLTEAIEPARDADGRIDVAGTMQIVTSVVEGWVREHPEQWLWLHRRWR